MDQILKQSTAITIPFGPLFVEGSGVRWDGSGLSSVTVAEAADAAAAITALDHAVTGIKLSKNGGALTIREQGGNFVATTFDTYGCFSVHLSAIDVGTLGRLRVIFSATTTYLAVWQDFMVVPSQVFESLFGSDKLDVNITSSDNIDFTALQKTTLNAAGSLTWTYTLTDNSTGLPIASTEVLLTTDSAGLNVIRTATTNSSGIATYYFNIADTGLVVYVWSYPDGYDPLEGDQETIG